MTRGPKPPADQPWWNTFFDNMYAEYGLPVSDHQMIAQVADFLMDELELAPGERVFDQCCGRGRFSIPLAERGVHVVGMDYSEDYVRTAREAIKTRNLAGEFHQGDAHDFVTSEPCDAAFNWYTSFGYDQDDEQNMQVLRGAFDSIKPGGLFALDYLNLPQRLKDFKPTRIDRSPEDEQNGLIVLDESEMDLSAGMFRSKWTFLLPDDKRIERRVEVRMFMPHEIAAMLRRCGFADIRFYGWVDKSPLSEDSRRCIALASRPS